MLTAANRRPRGSERFADGDVVLHVRIGPLRNGENDGTVVRVRAHEAGPRVLQVAGIDVA